MVTYWHTCMTGSTYMATNELYTTMPTIILHFWLNHKIPLELVQFFLGSAINWQYSSTELIQNSAQLWTRHRWPSLKQNQVHRQMVACTAPEGGGERERDAPALSAHAASSTQGQRRCGRKGSTVRWGDESLEQELRPSWPSCPLLSLAAAHLSFYRQERAAWEGGRRAHDGIERVQDLLARQVEVSLVRGWAAGTVCDNWLEVGG